MIYKYIIFISLISFFTLSRCEKKESGNNPPVQSDKPAIKGILVFHRYSCYTSNDSRIYIYDFTQNSLQDISGGWGIGNPMNAHFSPDGKSIVFMGTRPASGWDLFRWRLGSADAPVNLTSAAGNTRDEDPKYSANGTKIIFKQDGVLKEIDTLGQLLRVIPVPQAEASMPYYGRGDSVIVYSARAAGSPIASIFTVSVPSGSVYPVFSMAGVEAYYPITKNDTSFYFSCWASAADHNDQLYLGFTNGHPAQLLPVNVPGHNSSDACPVNSQYLIFSSTRPGAGGYDLFLGDLSTGKTWSLSLYHPQINSGGEELGASFYLEP
ncbi:MAG: PD40 domain-containing protein [Chitinophagaceae bacterium]|nr:PD40 domain-containing protein [Chitinophagaceae bacterium]